MNIYIVVNKKAGLIERIYEVASSAVPGLTKEEAKESAIYKIPRSTMPTDTQIVGFYKLDLQALKKGKAVFKRNEKMVKPKELT